MNVRCCEACRLLILSLRLKPELYGGRSTNSKNLVFKTLRTILHNIIDRLSVLFGTTQDRPNLLPFRVHTVTLPSEESRNLTSSVDKIRFQSATDRRNRLRAVFGTRAIVFAAQLPLMLYWCSTAGGFWRYPVCCREGVSDQPDLFRTDLGMSLDFTIQFWYFRHQTFSVVLLRRDHFLESSVSWRGHKSALEPGFIAYFLPWKI